MERRYTDMTSLDARPSSGIYPTKVSLHGKDFYGMMISLGEGAGWGGASRKNLNSIEEPTFITGYGRHVLSHKFISS